MEKCKHCDDGIIEYSSVDAFVCQSCGSNEYLERLEILEDKISKLEELVEILIEVH